MSGNWFSLKSQKKKSEYEIELIRFLINQLGYKPKALTYFHRALNHKSIAHTEGSLSNERLEFLGDAVLDAVIAEFLYEKFTKEDEGHLTKLKAKLVSRQSLSQIGTNLGLRNFIRYQKSSSINLTTLEGNAFEAILGAIFLDGGFDAVRKTINHYILRVHVDLSTILEEEIDFKSKLHIWAQRNKLNIEFLTAQESLDKGVWHYEMVVELNGQKYGYGKGTSKKIAEQKASKETLSLLGEI